MKEALIIGLVCLVSLVAYSPPVKAATFAPTSLDDSLDTGLADTRLNQYLPATTLYLYVYDNTALSGGEEQFKQWYKELYYHFIVQQKFTDIPFNYIVSEAGLLYKGKQGFYDVQPPLAVEADAPSNTPGVLLVGIPKESEKEVLIRQQLQSLVEWYRVTKAQTVQLTMVPANGNEPAKFSVAKPVSYTGLQLTKGDLEQRSYTVEVEKVDYPKETDQGVNFTVTATVVNKSDFPLYNRVPSLFYLATCSPHNKNSEFTEADTWASASRVNGFKDQVILPQATSTVEFKMSNPLQPGRYSEDFCAMVIPNKWFDKTKFTVNFTSKSTGLKLMRVQVTDFDFVNVRRQPRFNGDQLFRVSPGEIVIKEGPEENGWIKIKTRANQTGWVLGRYLRAL